MRFLLVLLMVALVAPSADAQGPRFGRDGCDPPYCVESGWIYDNVDVDHTTVWRHGMRVVPRFVSILFTPDPERGPALPVQWWPWGPQHTNPVSIELTRRAVKLQIHSGAVLMSHWRPPSEWIKSGWNHYREGYWKFIVYR